jgi:hypothetical protein
VVASLELLWGQGIGQRICLDAAGRASAQAGLQQAGRHKLADASAALPARIMRRRVYRIVWIA